MRNGLNPYKVRSKIPDAPDVSLCVVTHYTDDPYHKNRMDVVMMCLDTMLAGAADHNAELVVWDNGSTTRFKKMLRDWKPTTLIESQNVGLHNAQYKLAQLARGKVISICDDDVLFSPNWLDKQIEILKTFPSVGSVSGSPQRTAFRWATDANTKFVRSTPGARLETGRLIPDEWERDYCLSVQRDIEEHTKTTAHEADALISYKGVKAWAHGHHMQFLGYREVIQKHLFETPYYLDDGRRFNVNLDRAGYLNLTTHERTAVHIGNVIDENIREIARKMGNEVTNEQKNIPAIQGRRISGVGASA